MPFELFRAARATLQRRIGCEPLFSKQVLSVLLVL